MVEEGQGGHGIDDGDSSWDNAWIMASGCRECYWTSVAFGRGLGFLDGGDGFESNAKVDGFSSGDTAEHTACVVGLWLDTALQIDAKRVVVLASTQGNASKARADFEAFDGVDAGHRFGEIGAKLVKDRFTETGGNIVEDTPNNSSNGVSVVLNFFNQGLHLGGEIGVRASNGIGFDLFECDEIGLDFGAE